MSAAFRAHMPEGNAVIQIERRANGDGKFAHARFRRISQSRRYEIVRINFNNGDVRLWIDTAHHRVQPATILEADANGFGVFDHMRVGQDITFLADDYSRASAIVNG